MAPAFRGTVAHPKPVALTTASVPPDAHGLADGYNNTHHHAHQGTGGVPIVQTTPLVRSDTMKSDGSGLPIGPTATGDDAKGTLATLASSAEQFENALHACSAEEIAGEYVTRACKMPEELQALQESDPALVSMTEAAIKKEFPHLKPRFKMINGTNNTSGENNNNSKGPEHGIVIPPYATRNSTANPQTRQGHGLAELAYTDPERFAGTISGITAGGMTVLLVLALGICVNTRIVRRR